MTGRCSPMGVVIFMTKSIKIGTTMITYWLDLVSMEAVCLIPGLTNILFVVWYVTWIYVALTYHDYPFEWKVRYVSFENIGRIPDLV